MRRFLLVVLLLTSHLRVRCSWGDVDPNFQQCMRSCQRWECDALELNTRDKNSKMHMPYHIPLYQIVPLRCNEICNYGCIDQISQMRHSRNMGVAKYYGHWPFTRYFGLEEPASVIFSVLNAFPHAQFAWTSRQHLRSGKTCYMSTWLIAYSLMACICWLSSAIYHSKKTFQTTQLDLVTALGFIMFGLFIVIRRIIGDKMNQWHVTFLATTMAVGWSVRAYYMIHGQVSFDNHMKLSIGCVVATTTLWVLWILHAQFSRPPRTGLSVKYLCLLCQVWLMCASALEIFDFPPYYGVFDAHALWHLATVPLGYLWYYFWAMDAPYRTVKESTD